jgi:hypothetical protein
MTRNPSARPSLRPVPVAAGCTAIRVDTVFDLQGDIDGLPHEKNKDVPLENATGWAAATV